MIKGCSHHVMPYNSGWCVMSEANRRVIAHFGDREEAMAYARECAIGNEGSVLLHQTCLAGDKALSTVELPQQDDLSDFVHQVNPIQVMQGRALRMTDNSERSGLSDEQNMAFDPLLGYDEYYFEI